MARITCERLLTRGPYKGSPCGKRSLKITADRGKPTCLDCCLKINKICMTCSALTVHTFDMCGRCSPINGTLPLAEGHIDTHQKCDTPNCDRITTIKRKLCYDCKPKRPRGSNPCKHTFTKGSKKGKPCTGMTDDPTGYCTQCKKWRKFDEDGNEIKSERQSNTAPCKYIATKGPRRGKPCDKRTSHETGYCCKCRKVKSVRRELGLIPEDEPKSQLVFRTADGQIRTVTGDHLSEMMDALNLDGELIV